MKRNKERKHGAQVLEKIQQNNWTYKQMLLRRNFNIFLQLGIRERTKKKNNNTRQDFSLAFILFCFRTLIHSIYFLFYSHRIAFAQQSIFNHKRSLVAYQTYCVVSHFRIYFVVLFFSCFPIFLLFSFISFAFAILH